MSSQVRPTPMPTPALWVSTAVLIFGVGVLLTSALAWSFTLLVVGAVLVLGALVSTAALKRSDQDR